MVDNILNTLAASTPALRQRYLERIRSVPGSDARELEARLTELVARDRRAA